MKAQEWRQYSDAELQDKIKQFKKELFELRYQRKMGQVEKPSRFTLLRRDIARIMTILNERKRSQEREPAR